ncbi:hypothetical protein BDN72DRAFT_741151, partial [Pluteus cervinus]
GNRRFIHPAAKEQLVVMSAHMSASQIAAVTHISKRTVNRVIRLAKTTGAVIRKPLQCGRPRVLSSLDIAYLEAWIEHTPDIYVSELRELLAEHRDVDATEATIHTAL